MLPATMNNIDNEMYIVSNECPCHVYLRHVWSVELTQSNKTVKVQVAGFVCHYITCVQASIILPATMNNIDNEMYIVSN